MMSEHRPLLLDEILRKSAKNEVQVPLIAYPRENTVADFEVFTARDLDVFVDRAAKGYCKSNLNPLKEHVVSLIGPSDLDYLISKFALSRLGFGVLLLSTRLTPEACLKLMKESGSNTIVQSPSALSFSLGDRTRELDASISIVPLISSAVYRDEEWDSVPFAGGVRNREEAQHETAIIYHSSGSTGLPKSIATSHTKLISPIPTGKGSKALTASPLCHAFASKLTINCMMAGKCMYLANANMPYTSNGLVEMFQAASPDVFFTVPYVLKLLGETNAGVRALAQCKQVVSSGSTLSDELGNRLVKEGVNVETLFAGTEPGLVGTSMNRPPGDLAWDYIRLPPALQANTHFKSLGDNTFEFVYLNTLPTLNVSNSSDPPGSFHSSDIFVPHPTILHAWKYIGRVDDRLTLSTGEKVLPLPMEGRVREEPYVREAVVFGIDRAVPGLLVFRSELAKDMSDDEFINQIWPSVAAGNTVVEAFGKIAREMIVPLPAGAFVPSADKESIIRAKVYRVYQSEIEDAYARLEGGSSSSRVWDLKPLEELILRLIRVDIGLHIADLQTDFHQAGMDSLGAIRLRGLILRHVSTTQAPSQNVVFEAGNSERLAQSILASTKSDHKQDGQLSEGGSLAFMHQMIDQYSKFSLRSSRSMPFKSETTVLLTGTTGSLGAHLLVQLLELPQVSRVYCIVRGEDPTARVRQSLQQRKLSAGQLGHKAIVVGGDFGLPNLGLSLTALEDIRQNITHIIHSAWPVNFQLSLRAFHPQIRGLHDLLDLSLSNERAVSTQLLFCSSVSVAMATPPPAKILETPISNLSHASSTGYAQSKLVGERIIEKAVEDFGANATNLRIGQIVGDTTFGIWNSSEAWPLVIRSALTLKVLPAFPMTCSWLPVDVLASAIIDVALASPRETLPVTLNMENPHTFDWTRDLLPALSEAGIQFEVVSPQVWLERLEHYAKTTPEDEALYRNPAVKLLDYFAQLVQDLGEKQRTGELVFDTRLAQAHSPSLRAAPKIESTGLITKFVTEWLKVWS